MNKRICSFNFFQHSQQIQADLAQIHDHLGKLPSFQEIHQLTCLLNQTLLNFKHLKATAVAPDHLNDIEEQIIRTYGSIHDTYIKRQLTEIQEAARELETARNDQMPTAQLVTALQHQVDLLLDNYRPSIEERKFLSRIKNLINNSKLQEQPASQEICAEEGEDLFQIASLLYNGEIRAAKTLFNQLSFDVKEFFESKIKQLMAIPFEDRLETLQALLVTMHEITGSREAFPSQQEIDELFLGLRQLDTLVQERLFHDIKAPADDNRRSG